MGLFNREISIFNFQIHSTMKKRIASFAFHIAIFSKFINTLIEKDSL
jgi:hypothetical protein